MSTVMLGLALAADYAVTAAWRERCKCQPNIRIILVNFRGSLMVRLECDENSRVCEEAVWALNEALERLGYTATYRTEPGYRRVEATLYRGPDDMARVIAVGET